MEHDDRWPRSTGARIVQLVVIASSIVVGAGLLVISLTLGRCDAFGGRCPTDRPPWWQDDVFGMAVSGAALMVMVPWFLHRPSLRRLGLVVVVGTTAAVIVGLIVSDIAAS